MSITSRTVLSTLSHKELVSRIDATGTADWPVSAQEVFNRFQQFINAHHPDSQPSSKNLRYAMPFPRRALDNDE